MKKKIFIIVSCLFLLFMATILGINTYIKNSVKDLIVSQEITADNFDCIIVLGAGIWGDKPSPMLEDRLNEAIKLYKSGIASKIIMSGDHGRKEYDEVNIMKEYAIENGVESSDIFMDHAGFSTYDSIYRAKEIFLVKKAIIVTQKYHLYRALYIAKKLGIEVYGVNADPRKYVGESMREIREILARNKDFFKVIFKSNPKYLGDTIPVSGNGDITNDKV